MPTIKERNQDLVYSRAERENNWAAALLIVLFLIVLGGFAFLILAGQNDKDRLTDQLQLQERLDSSGSPQQQPVFPMPTPVPYTQTRPEPTPYPLQTPSSSTPPADSSANPDSTPGRTSTGQTDHPGQPAGQDSDSFAPETFPESRLNNPPNQQLNDGNREGTTP